MKTHQTVVLAMLAGVGIGGLAVQGIHAQAKPPAYYIVEIDVKNEDIFNKQWAPKADETIKNAGGTYLVRSAAIEGIEGPVPKLVLISKWDNIDTDGLAFIRSILADAANSRQGRQICAVIYGRRHKVGPSSDRQLCSITRAPCREVEARSSGCA
jgi:uncharacterized protein (DUF1330 family)